MGSDDGSLHAVDLEKGAPVWSAALGARVRATPAVAGERGGGGRLRGSRGRGQARRTGHASGRASSAHAVYSSAVPDRISRRRWAATTEASTRLTLAGGEPAFSLPEPGTRRLLPDRRGRPPARALHRRRALHGRRAPARCCARASLAAEGAQSSPALDGDTPRRGQRPRPPRVPPRGLSARG